MLKLTAASTAETAGKEGIMVVSFPSATSIPLSSAKVAIVLMIFDKVNTKFCIGGAVDWLDWVGGRTWKSGIKGISDSQVPKLFVS